MFATPALPTPTPPVRTRVPALVGDSWESRVDA